MGRLISLQLRQPQLLFRAVSELDIPVQLDFYSEPDLAEELQHGILGTKVFEAIGIEKPFMLIPSDEENLAQLISETGIGIAASDIEEIKTFITQQYQQWQQDGYTRCTIEDKSRFSRTYQARLMEDILNTAIA